MGIYQQQQPTYAQYAPMIIDPRTLQAIQQQGSSIIDSSAQQHNLMQQCEQEIIYVYYILKIHISIDYCCL
jgi:hypothetical protein